METHGCLVKTVHVRGRFHSGRNSAAADSITEFFNSSGRLQLAAANELKVPVRSTVNGEVIERGSLLQHCLENTLLMPANWYQTLSAAILHLPEDRKFVAFVGIGSHIPASLMQTSGLRVLHMMSNFENIASSQPDQTTPDNGAAESIHGNSANTNYDPPTDYNDRQPDYPPHSIAIVGMAGRFPGADDLNELWDLLMAGGVTVEPAPARLGLPVPKVGDDSSPKWWGNFLRNPGTFDHRFFKKSSREALHWDPQILEVTYEALESAGYFGPSSTPQPEDYGCYIGVVMNNYEDNVSCHPASAYATIGTNRSFFSGTVSHHFGCR